MEVVLALNHCELKALTKSFATLTELNLHLGALAVGLELFKASAPATHPPSLMDPSKR